MAKFRHKKLQAIAMLAAILTPLSLVACRSGGGQMASSHPRPSAEPDTNTLVQDYGGRAPRPCPAIKQKPTDAEAAVLAQCTMEGSIGSTETLLTDVQVHVTGPRKFSTNSVGAYTGQDNNRKDIDKRADVLDITGYAHQFACGVQAFSPGQSCTITEMPGGVGVCWKTNYGEYRCGFASAGGNGYKLGPPPTSY